MYRDEKQYSCRPFTTDAILNEARCFIVFCETTPILFFVSSYLFVMEPYLITY